MDQSKTDLPHFAQATKKTLNLPTLPTHITGVIAHGLDSFVFINNTEFGRGANLTITVFLHVLQHIFNMEKIQRMERKPKYLHVQVSIKFSFCIRTYSM